MYSWSKIVQFHRFMHLKPPRKGQQRRHSPEGQSKPPCEGRAHVQGQTDQNYHHGDQGANSLHRKNSCHERP